MKSLSPIAILAITLALGSGCRSAENPAMIDLPPRQFSAELEAKGDSALLIDVRTPEEFGSGHLPGALLLDFQSPSFSDEVGKLPKDRPLYIYCRSGRRSKASAPVFLDAGFRQVTNLAGGIVGWEAAGLPVGKE